jgi:RNA-directed DNA polymerase
MTATSSASQRAGERVRESIEQFLAKRLKLKVNKAKSAVAKPSVRKFLGFSFGSMATFVRSSISVPCGSRAGVAVRGVSSRRDHRSRA